MKRPKYQNLIDLIEKRAQSSSAEITFLKLGGKTETLSYQKIHSNATKVAQHIQAMDVPEGSVIALFLPTGPDFCAAFFGVQLAGCIPVSIYPPLKLQNISQWKNLATHQMRDVGVALALTDNRIIKVLGEPLADAPVKFGAKTIQDLLSIAPAPSLTVINRKINDIAFLQFSSGTTGHSKAVSITHFNALTNAEAILDGLQIETGGSVTVSWLPLYHDMGLIGAFISSIVADGKLFLMNPEHFIIEPLDWLRAISRFKANITVAPNFAYNLCTRKLTEHFDLDIDLSSLQIALCGAEMIHPSTVLDFNRNFAKFGLKPGTILPVYGLAEATLAVTFTEVGRNQPLWRKFNRDTLRKDTKVDLDENGIEIVSVGKPLNNIQVEIRDTKNQVLPDEFFGHIWVKSPSIMLKYFNNPELTSATIIDGWLKTGDNGFKWDQQLYICGREKEIIIIRGQNYDPTLIERSLNKIPDLRAGCAVSFSAPLEDDATEDLVIIAELRKGLKWSEYLSAEIRNSINQAVLEDHALSVKVVDLYEAGTLPRTSSGKIKRNLCKKLWALKVLGSGKNRFVMVNIYWYLFKSLIAHLKLRLRKVL